MTAVLAHPSRSQRSGRPTTAPLHARAAAAVARRRTRRSSRLSVREAWRLLSDDPPEFGDDD